MVPSNENGRLALPKIVRPILAAVLAMALTTPSHAFFEEHVENIRAAIAAGEVVQCAGCNLSYADLSGLDFSGADLQGAYMYGARMNGAIMRGANLNRSDFTRADISGVDFSDASMDSVRMTSAKRCETIMPDGTRDDRHC
jgi:uncharacterized protein YjbI with pentapeptide repeats